MTEVCKEGISSRGTCRGVCTWINMGAEGV